MPRGGFGLQVTLIRKSLFNNDLRCLVEIRRH
jgi:hypothetical protein